VAPVAPLLDMPPWWHGWGKNQYWQKISFPWSSMSFLQLAQTLLVVLMLSAGQVLFRRAALGVPPLGTVTGLLRLAGSPVFILALTLYGVATLLWVAVLQQVPLSRAYPFMALAFLLVPLSAMIFLGEPVNARLLAGSVLILAGLILAAQSS
jgi:drug/metabolite transporter (DMT)-like permease